MTAMPSFGLQVALLFILASPIACVAWTVTHEEIFREPRGCEHCFSHYVTIGFLILTRYRLWLDDWRGYVLAGFSLVFIANAYMGLFGELRLEIRQDRQEIAENDEMAEMRRVRRRSISPSSSPPPPPASR